MSSSAYYQDELDEYRQIEEELETKLEDIEEDRFSLLTMIFHMAILILHGEDVYNGQQLLFSTHTIACANS